VNVCSWRRADEPVCPLHVGFRRRSREHLLDLRITGFDPQETLHARRAIDLSPLSAPRLIRINAVRFVIDNSAFTASAGAHMKQIGSLGP
jgi:hypothetical protein